MTIDEIEKQRRLDYGWTFGTAQGKNVLTDLANRYNMFAVHNTRDPIEMAFLEGQRSVILDIIATAAATSFEDRKQQILGELKDGR